MTLVERWATAELATAELATVELQLNYKLNSSLKLRKLYVTCVRIQIILKIKYIVDIVHSTEKHQHPEKYKINSWAEARWHIFALWAAGVGFPKMNLGRFSNQKRVSNKKKCFPIKKGFPIRVSEPDNKPRKDNPIIWQICFTAFFNTMNTNTIRKYTQLEVHNNGIVFCPL